MCGPSMSDQGTKPEPNQKKTNNSCSKRESHLPSAMDGEVYNMFMMFHVFERHLALFVALQDTPQLPKVHLCLLIGKEEPSGLGIVLC